MEYKNSDNPINLIQETPETEHFHDQEPEENDNDDALSLCDLPLHDDDPDLIYSSTTATPDFEFSTTKILHNTDPDILFFGKSIPYVNRPQTTSSFKLRQTQLSPFHVATAVTPPPRRTRSRPVRLPETGKLRYHSSSGAANSTLKQYHVLIGLGVKFDPPQMLGLGEMRKRQSRKAAPSPTFSGSGGEQPGVAGGKGGAGKGHGGLARLLRFRSNLVSALTCIRHV